MKLEMTERDRKLLIGLAIGVIIVCIGYWGILPIISDIQEIEDEIEVQSALEQVNAMKILKLPILEMENEEYEKDILSTRAEFYKILTSDEIDKIFTGKAILHSLYAYDMNIIMPTDVTSLEPYKYSKRALNGEEEEEEADLDWGIPMEPTLETEESTDLFADEEEDDSLIGIYTAVISMRLGGDPENLDAFLADLADEGIKLRLCSFSYTDNRSVAPGTGNTYDIVIDRTLDVQLEIYMCEE